MTLSLHKQAAETVLMVKGLRKKIGKSWIIHGVDFEVKAGEIFGFLGPNGSGKTTTIRMIVDLIKPTAGEVLISGFNVHKNPELALLQVGCIVENPEMYPYLTGWENLEHFARMLPNVGSERIAEVVEVVQMTEAIHDKVKTYSLGMRQRLGIAQALLGNPKLLILDEPTNGLDPKGIKELRAFIRKLAQEGMSIFISSHLLSEIQLMCDKVAIINGGHVLATGSVSELLEQADSYVIWSFEDSESGLEILKEQGDVQILEPGEHHIDDGLLADISEPVVTKMDKTRVPLLLKQLSNHGVDVLSVQMVAPTLEQLFLQMTEGTND